MSKKKSFKRGNAVWYYVIDGAAGIHRGIITMEPTTLVAYSDGTLDPAYLIKPVKSSYKGETVVVEEEHIFATRQEAMQSYLEALKERLTQLMQEQKRISAILAQEEVAVSRMEDNGE